MYDISIRFDTLHARKQRKCNMPITYKEVAEKLKIPYLKFRQIKIGFIYARPEWEKKIADYYDTTPEKLFLKRPKHKRLRAIYSMAAEKPEISA